MAHNNHTYLHMHDPDRDTEKKGMTSLISIFNIKKMWKILSWVMGSIFRLLKLPIISLTEKVMWLVNQWWKQYKNVHGCIHVFDLHFTLRSSATISNSIPIKVPNHISRTLSQSSSLEIECPWCWGCIKDLEPYLPMFAFGWMHSLRKQ